jgi:ribosome biogenesis GTPase
LSHEPKTQHDQIDQLQRSQPHHDLTPYGDPDLVLARVSRVDRGICDVLPENSPNDPIRATLSGAVLSAAAADPTTSPTVGDWVAVRRWPDGRVSLEHVLPRRTLFVRAQVTPGSSQQQVLAANVDIALVVEGLHPEPDLGRIERFLALAWDCGAQPLVALTKADLVPDADAHRLEVAAVAPGVDVVVLSAVTGEGLDALRAYVTPGVTLALLGPSGAGKSTLTNALSGEDRMPTRALRADGKGRHTTAHRELVPLAGGAALIDTPGLRSVGLTAMDGDGLDMVFADIDELAAACRFTDCTHGQEPGCAVLAAVDSGELEQRRLASWRKLQREARWMATRHDARLRAVEAARWKSITKEVRRSGRVRH